MPIQPGEQLVQSQGVNVTERVTVMLTADQLKWLKDQVIVQNKSMGQIVREAITKQQEVT